MTKMLSRPLTLGLLCAIALTPAAARDKLDNPTIARFGGSYAVDCNDKLSPRLHVVPDALIVDRGKQRMTAHDPIAWYHYLGPKAPKTFKVALQARVRGEFELLFMVSNEGDGNIIDINGAANVRATLGPTVVGQKFRQCEGAGLMVTGGVPAEPRKESPVRDNGIMTSPTHIGAHDPSHPAYPLMDWRFRKVWRDAVGVAGRTPWISNLEGPMLEPQWVTVGGKRYVFNAYCKPHDCYDNNVVQLYDPVALRVYGLVHQTQVDALVGNPPPDETLKLQQLWIDTWRRHIK